MGDFTNQAVVSSNVRAILYWWSAINEILDPTFAYLTLWAIFISFASFDILEIETAGDSE
jgi:hypothetical protein